MYAGKSYFGPLVFESVSVLRGSETERYELQSIWCVETSGVIGETSTGGSPDPLRSLISVYHEVKVH